MEEGGIDPELSLVDAMLEVIDKTSINEAVSFIHNFKMGELVIRFAAKHFLKALIDHIMIELDRLSSFAIHHNAINKYNDGFDESQVNIPTFNQIVASASNLLSQNLSAKNHSQNTNVMYYDAANDMNQIINDNFKVNLTNRMNILGDNNNNNNNNNNKNEEKRRSSVRLSEIRSENKTAYLSFLDLCKSEFSHSMELYFGYSLCHTFESIMNDDVLQHICLFLTFNDAFYNLRYVNSQFHHLLINKLKIYRLFTNNNKKNNNFVKRRRSMIEYNYKHKFNNNEYYNYSLTNIDFECNNNCHFPKLSVNSLVDYRDDTGIYRLSRIVEIRYEDIKSNDDDSEPNNDDTQSVASNISTAATVASVDRNNKHSNENKHNKHQKHNGHDSEGKGLLSDDEDENENSHKIEKFSKIKTHNNKNSDKNENKETNFQSSEMLNKNECLCELNHSKKPIAFFIETIPLNRYGQPKTYWCMIPSKIYRLAKPNSLSKRGHCIMYKNHPICSFWTNENRVYEMLIDVQPKHLQFVLNDNDFNKWQKRERSARRRRNNNNNNNNNNETLLDINDRTPHVFQLTAKPRWLCGFVSATPKISDLDEYGISAYWNENAWFMIMVDIMPILNDLKVKFNCLYNKYKELKKVPYFVHVDNIDEVASFGTYTTQEQQKHANELFFNATHVLGSATTFHARNNGWVNLW